MTSSPDTPIFDPSERFRLDTDSPIPLYHQMERIILSRIEKEGKIGRRLPREMDLMKIFGVSRATVKKTTAQLADKGLIERKRAIGTRIIRTNITEDLGRLKSYTEQMKSKGFDVRTQMLGIKSVKPRDEVRERLNLSEDEKVIVIRRLRGTSKVFPVVLLESSLPERLGIHINENFSGSLYDVLEHDHDIPIEWAEETIGARNATRAEAKLLEIEPHDTVLVMERLTCTRHDQPIEFVRAIYRPEHYSFTIRLKR